jgi:hypothetical protein
MMTRNTTGLFALALITCTLSRAQDAVKSQLLDLRTPPSPAFVLLGIEPTSVNKPTTPRAVAASFVSALRQGGAMEVAPYWTVSHPMLTYEDYSRADTWETILQTMSISFATTPRSQAKDSLGTIAGVGARWMFIKGNPRDTLRILHDRLIEIDNQINATDDSVKQNSLMKQAREVALRFQREEKERVGFRLEMATALTMNFADDDFAKGRFHRWGVWLTGAYLWDNPQIDFLAVVRLMGNGAQDATQNVLDFGARLVAPLNDFSISLEYIHRAELSTSGTTVVAGGTSGTFFLKSTYRLAGNIEYRYSKDVSVNLVFGRNYASDSINNRPLVAQVGLNLGLGAIPAVSSR